MYMYIRTGTTRIACWPVANSGYSFGGQWQQLCTFTLTTACAHVLLIRGRLRSVYRDKHGKIDNGGGRIEISININGNNIRKLRQKIKSADNSHAHTKLKQQHQQLDHWRHIAMMMRITIVGLNESRIKMNVNNKMEMTMYRNNKSPEWQANHGLL